MGSLSSIYFGLIILTLLPACTKSSDGTSNPNRLTVFAAASLSEAFQEMGKRFEAEHPGIEVAFNFAGSQQLTRQLTQGAPADIFASANQRMMEIVIESDRISGDVVHDFLTNRLIVIVPHDNPAKIVNIDDLAKADVDIILADNDVPAGTYAMEFLAGASKSPGIRNDYKESVLRNVVSYEDNVRFVLTKVALGEADAGIVYISDTFGKDTDKIQRIIIPDELNPVAQYQIAPIHDSKDLEMAGKFIEFILSDDGQVILEKHGFIPIKNY